MPARFAAIIRAAMAFGIEAHEPSSGSHWRMRKNGKTYTIPSHNGKKQEIGDVYIRGLCRAFEINEAEFRKLL